MGDVGHVCGLGGWGAAGSAEGWAVARVASVCGAWSPCNCLQLQLPSGTHPPAHPIHAVLLEGLRTSHRYQHRRSRVDRQREGEGG